MKDTLFDRANSPTSGPSPRRLTLKSAMAVIAAVAGGLALVRYSQMRYFIWQEPIDSSRLVYHTLLHVGWAVYGSLPVLYALCVVVVLAGLRGTRPRREEFTVRPGLAACTAALVALVASVVFRLLNYAIGRYPGIYWARHAFDVLIATAPGLWSPNGIDELFQTRVTPLCIRI